MRLGEPPGIQTGQPLTYYQHLCTRLHESSFSGHEVHIGMIELGTSTRVIHVHMKDGVAIILSLLTVEGDALEGVSLTSSPTLIKQTLQEKGHHSSLFDDMLIFYDALTVLHFDDDGSPSFMEWYDPSYWDRASFIEETFPQSSPTPP